jgi:predicted ATPase/DNA-binding SARP family transcriptional activator
MVGSSTIHPPADRLWHIRLLGGIALNRPSEQITRFRSQKTAALLAYLALNAGQSHPRDRLVDLLWPDLDVDSGRNNLRVSLASLRRQLEPAGVPSGSVLVADRASVRLNPAAFESDAALFLAAVQDAGQAKDSTEEATLLERATHLYGGELLPGIYEPCIDLERERIHRIYLSALRLLVHVLTEIGDVERASQAAAALHREDLDEEPAPHEAHALPVRADSFRPSVAASGLRIEPTRDFSPAETRFGCATSFGLPPAFTQFCGRETELTALRALTTCQNASEPAALITITGTGGAGKTRLAVEFARAFTSEVGCRAAFVPLADLRDASHVEAALREALRLPPSQDENSLGGVIDCIASQVGLLVLDNVEQLLQDDRDSAAVCSLVAQIRSGAPDVVLLGTSRRPLGLAGEQEFPLEPLPTPARPGTPERLLEFASVALFAKRAQAVRPDFRVTASNAAAVADLCRRLDGLPLAIELAAAWSKTLSPAQMLRRTRTRLDLLVSRRTDRHPRHRTLRDAIAWSSGMLSPARQQLFAALSVFRGGWSLAAAEAVCMDASIGECALDALSDLVDCSLVVTDVANRAGADEVRFRMLETIREYAEEQLSEDERALFGRRHLDYFLEVAEACEKGLADDQRESLDRAEAEIDNFRAALSFAAQTDDPRSGLLLASRLSQLWELRGHVAEGRKWIETFLEPAVESCGGKIVARGCLAAACLAHVQCDYERARDLYDRARALFLSCGDTTRAAEALRRRHPLLVLRGRSEDAARDLRECARVFEEAGDGASLASTYGHLANIYRGKKQFEDAEELYEKSLAIYRQAGDKVGLAVVLCDYAFLMEWRGDFDRAIHLLEESLDLCRAVGNLPGAAHTLWLLANVVSATGDDNRALALGEESLAIHRQLGRRAGIIYCLGNIAEIRMRRGELAACRETLDERLALCRQIGDVKETARTLGFLGHTARRERRFPDAQARFSERLALYRMEAYPRGVCVALCDLAVLEREFGRRADAFRQLLDAVTTLREMPPDDLTAGHVALAAAEIGFLEDCWHESALLDSAALGLLERAHAPSPRISFPDAAKRRAALAARLDSACLARIEADGRALSLAALLSAVESLCA